MLEVTGVTTEILDIPQKVVFETAKGVTDIAHAVIVTVTAEGGLEGKGDGTPVGYVTGESRETVLADIASIEKLLVGRDARDWRGFCYAAREALPHRATACAALEMAVVDLFCKSAGISMAQFFGGVKPSVVSDLTIPILPPEQAFELAREAADTYSSLKIKVGGADKAEDMERVRQIHLGAPEAKLRIDANQGFEPEEAVRFVRKMNDLGISPEFVEQPVDKADMDGLKYVKENVAEPVLADEAAVDPASVIRLVKADAVDGVNIKLMKAGLTGALDIIAICRAADKQLMLGCMLESPIGIGTAVHLSAGTGAFDYLDLDADVLGKPTGIPQNYIREGEVLTPIHP